MELPNATPCIAAHDNPGELGKLSNYSFFMSTTGSNCWSLATSPERGIGRRERLFRVDCVEKLQVRAN
jgi:hypothetical protein